MSECSRRTFLKSASGGVLASTSLLTLSGTSNASTGGRVRHAIIGFGSQGRHHAKTFASFDDCDVVAVCDLDPQRRAQAAKELPNTDRVAQVEDFRAILDNREIDSVSVATPDHWHASIALAAMKAGKHVYVEKPCCHNVREGVLLTEAAKRYHVCVQHGTQSRSGKGI